MCSDLGLVSETFTQTGSGHYRLVVRTPGGNRFMTVFALTPSDHRWSLNQRAFLRRKIRELDGRN